MAEQREFRQFLLLVFPLLALCFALWYLVAAFLAAPAIGIANLALSGLFPEIVSALHYRGADAVLLTTFGELNGLPVPPGQSDYQLGFTVDTRLVSYSLPFYTALHFATPKQDYLGAYFSGALVLYLLMALALFFICLQDLVMILGPLFVEHPGAMLPPPAFIALLYQFSVLLFPTLGPVAIWAWQNRETRLFRGLIEERPGDPDQSS